jgi:hypothetical protein
MPFDYEEYQKKCNTLTTEQLHKEWENIQGESRKYLGDVEEARMAVEKLALTELDKFLEEQRQLQRVFFSLL